MPFYPSNVDLQGFVFRKAGGIVGGVIGGGTPPIGGNLVWEALVPDASGVMQGVEVGTGGLTVPRVSRINLSDSASLYQAFAGGEPGWEGGRVEGAEGSRVVYATESGGQPLAEMPCLVHAPEATNLFPDSRDFTLWTKSVADCNQNQIGIDGVENKACIVTDTAGSGIGVIYANTIMDAPDGFGYTIWIQKNHDLYSFPLFRDYGADPGSELAAGYLLSTDDGRVYPHSGIGVDPSHSYVVKSEGDWWKFTVLVDSARTGNYANLFYPSRTSVNPDGTPGDDDSSLYGSKIYDQMQLHVGDISTFADLPPITTSGAAVTRDADGYVWDSANWNNTEGSFYGEVFVTGICNILGGFLAYDGAAIDLTDGTALQSLAAPMGQLVKVGAIWGGGSMKLNVNGSWHGTGSSYNGALLTGPLDFGRNSSFVLKGRKFKRWDVVDESLINAEMQA